MEIAVYSQEFALTESLRRHTGLQIAAALEHHQHHVTHVEVRLRDVNGPRGGRDKACEIVVALRHHGRVVVKEYGDDLYSAIRSATHRVKHLLDRRCERTRERQRWWHDEQNELQPAGQPS